MTEIEDLYKISEKIREQVIEMLLTAGSGHSAGALGMADVFAALYFNLTNHDPNNPTLPDRDRVILSNGHICPVLYATLALNGYFPVAELSTLRKLGSRLQGHPHNLSLPGIENSGGPLGQGVSIALGMAIAAQINQAKYRIYCIMGDGEQDEGEVWEGLLYAGAKKLNNITFILDRNNIQIDGFTEHVMPLEPLREKYQSFGLHVLEIDGNNIEQIIASVNESKAIFEKPTIIIAHTIPGKGVPFMEFDPAWHGKAPNKQEAIEALKDLRTLKDRIECYDKS